MSLSLLSSLVFHTRHSIFIYICIFVCISCVTPNNNKYSRPIPMVLLYNSFVYNKYFMVRCKKE